MNIIIKYFYKFIIIFCAQFKNIFIYSNGIIKLIIKSIKISDYFPTKSEIDLKNFV